MSSFLINQHKGTSKNWISINFIEKRPVLSATIHPDLKRTLVAMSERTGLSISQVTDEVLYTGLVEMQEIDEL